MTLTKKVVTTHYLPNGSIETIEEEFREAIGEIVVIDKHVFECHEYLDSIRVKLITSNPDQTLYCLSKSAFKNTLVDNIKVGAYVKINENWETGCMSIIPKAEIIDSRRIKYI